MSERAHLMAEALKDWPDVAFLVRGAACGVGFPFAGKEPDEPYIVENYVGDTHEEAMTAKLAKEMAAGRIFDARDWLPRGVSALGMVERLRKGKLKYRPVWDYSRPSFIGVNDWIYLQKDEFTSVKDAYALLRPGMYMVKVDLEEAYRSWPVASQYWAAKCFQWHGVRYMDTRSPFGNRALPGIFMRYTRAIGMCGCRRKGYRASDGARSTASIDEERVQQVTDKLREMRAEAATGPVRRRKLESLLGLLAFCAQVVWRLSLYTREGLALVAATSGMSRVAVSTGVMQDLKVVERVIRLYNGRMVVLHKEDMHEDAFATDASLRKGMGGHCQPNYFLVSWEDLAEMPQRDFYPFTSKARSHINYLELFAVDKFWGPVEYIPLLRKIFYLCAQHDIRLRPKYISSKDNLLADLLSRLKLEEFHMRWAMRKREVLWRQDRDDWQFSPILFAEMDEEFGPFTLDACVASSRANTFCVRSWSAEDDARKQRFDGLNAWANLPFPVMYEILLNFLKCKRKQHMGTGGCFLVPVWEGDEAYELVSVMRVVFRPVRKYRAGTMLFTAPALDGKGRSDAEGPGMGELGHPGGSGPNPAFTVASGWPLRGNWSTARAVAKKRMKAVKAWGNTMLAGLAASPALAGGAGALGLVVSGGAPGGGPAGGPAGTFTLTHAQLMDLLDMAVAKAAAAAGGALVAPAGGTSASGVEGQYRKSLAASQGKRDGWSVDRHKQVRASRLAEGAKLRDSLLRFRSEHSWKRPGTALEAHAFPELAWARPILEEEGCDIDELPAGEEASLEDWCVLVHLLRVRVTGMQDFVKGKEPGVIFEDVLDDSFARKRQRSPSPTTTGKRPQVDPAAAAGLRTVTEEQLQQTLMGTLSPEAVPKPADWAAVSLKSSTVEASRVVRIAAWRPGGLRAGPGLVQRALLETRC
eukprot:gene34465-biopygen30827